MALPPEAREMHYVTLSGWRRVWFGRLVTLPVIFYPLVWFDCSVPFTRGRLSRLIRPQDELRRPPHPPPAGPAGVRVPRRPVPSAPARGVAAQYRHGLFGDGSAGSGPGWPDNPSDPG